MKTFLTHPALRITCLALSVLLAIFIGVFSILPASEGPGLFANLPFPFPDKAQHFVAYAILAGPLTIVLGPRRTLMAVLLVLGYGILMEIAQILAPTGREGSWLDALADLAGACTGACIIRFLRGS